MTEFDNSQGANEVRIASDISWSDLFDAIIRIYKIAVLSFEKKKCQKNPKKSLSVAQKSISIGNSYSKKIKKWLILIDLNEIFPIINLSIESYDKNIAENSNSTDLRGWSCRFTSILKCDCRRSFSALSVDAFNACVSLRSQQELI